MRTMGFSEDITESILILSAFLLHSMFGEL